MDVPIKFKRNGAADKENVGKERKNPRATNRAALLDLDNNKLVARRPERCVNETRSKIPVRKSVRRTVSLTSDARPECRPVSTTCKSRTSSCTEQEVPEVEHKRVEDEVFAKPATRTIVLPADVFFSKGFKTIISDGIPNDVSRLAKKNTLPHRSSANKQKAADFGFVDAVDHEYTESIVRYLKKKERATVLPINFLQHKEASSTIRIEVVNWLIKLHAYLSLPTSVLFVSVHLFDVALFRIAISPQMYQLVGIAATWIAVKSDYIPMTAGRMLDLARNRFALGDLLNVERKLLKLYKFNTVNLPEPSYFLHHYMEEIEFKDEQLWYMALYVLECYTLNENFSTTVSSLQANAALILVVRLFIGAENLHSPSDQSSSTDKIVQEMIEQVLMVQDVGYSFRQPYVNYSTADKKQVSLVLQHLLTPRSV